MPTPTPGYWKLRYWPLRFWHNHYWLGRKLAVASGIAAGAAKQTDTTGTGQLTGIGDNSVELTDSTPGSVELRA